MSYQRKSMYRFMCKCGTTPPDDPDPWRESKSDADVIAVRSGFRIGKDGDLWCARCMERLAQDGKETTDGDHETR